MRSEKWIGMARSKTLTYPVKERPVGSYFRLAGGSCLFLVREVKDITCMGCSFEAEMECLNLDICATGHCFCGLRNDGKSVVFVAEGGWTLEENHEYERIINGNINQKNEENGPIRKRKG